MKKNELDFLKSEIDAFDKYLNEKVPDTALKLHIWKTLLDAVEAQIFRDAIQDFLRHKIHIADLREVIR